MEVHRRAAKRPGAEDRVIIHEREPEFRPQADGSLILHADNVPSWRDDGNHFDYDIMLTPDDLARLKTLLGKA